MNTDTQDKAPSNVPILAVREVEKTFGGVRALSTVSFEVPEGRVLALIGPNGAGKTTLFNVITNVLPTDAGETYFAGIKLTGMSTVQVASLGLIRTFQTARVLPGMTVLDNVVLGRHRLMQTHGFSQMLWLRRSRLEELRTREQAEYLLEITGLTQYRDAHAVLLPVGAQKLVEIARALMAAPRLLCLDEPAAGLNDRETQELSVLLSAVRHIGITVLIVEHNMSLVMSLADRIVVLDAGQVVTEGTPAEVRQDPRVIEAYLGSADHARS